MSHRLVELGWTPVILAASVEHNTLRQRLADGETRGTTQEGGVTFRWLRTSTYRGNGLGRILSLVQFTMAVMRPRSLRGLPRPDIIIGSTVHPFAAWAASRLAKRLRVPFIFEIRDLWPQTLIDMGHMKQDGIPARLLRALEARLCSRAAAIISLLPRAADYLSSVGVDPTKVFWISNGTDVEEFAETATQQDRPVTTSNSFTFGYFGSLGQANGVATIITAFAKGIDSGRVAASRLVIVGDGPQRPALELLVAKLEIESYVEFKAAVPKHEIPAISAGMDALVVNVLDLDIYRFGISLNKLFDYMASGRPTIIASNSVNNPIRDCNGGICVGADDADAMADAMVTMAGIDPARRAEWGANAVRNVAEKYDYRVLGEQLDGLLRDVLRSNR